MKFSPPPVKRWRFLLRSITESLLTKNPSQTLNSNHFLRIRNADLPQVVVYCIFKPKVNFIYFPVFNLSSRSNLLSNVYGFDSWLAVYFCFCCEIIPLNIGVTNLAGVEWFIVLAKGRLNQERPGIKLISSRLKKTISRQFSAVLAGVFFLCPFAFNFNSPLMLFFSICKLQHIVYNSCICIISVPLQFI